METAFVGALAGVLAAGAGGATLAKGLVEVFLAAAFLAGARLVRADTAALMVATVLATVDFLGVAAALAAEGVFTGDLMGGGMGGAFAADFAGTGLGGADFAEALREGFCLALLGVSFAGALADLGFSGFMPWIWND